jgi:addiction module RelE/StbE family toxin
MKQIVRKKTFEKHYKARVAPSKKLNKKFIAAYVQFCAGRLGYPLHDHALTGNLQGLRSFSVTPDMRVIYAEDKDYIVFLDIGSHAQLYH